MAHTAQHMDVVTECATAFVHVKRVSSALDSLAYALEDAIADDDDSTERVREAAQLVERRLEETDVRGVAARLGALTDV